MSNPYALAAVTTTWSQLLQEASAEPSLSGTKVTTGPPDRARTVGTGRQLNLFLYRLTPNGAWRNSDLPTRNQAGAVVARPVLALNLHYLLTAYGAEDEDLDAQHLMAHAMSLTHDAGVLTRDRVRAAVAAQPAVAPSDLADQVELVKLTPEAIGMEELSRLWGTFPNAAYRLSVGYEASVVLVDRPQRTKAAGLPVRTANVEVQTRRPPVIESVSPAIVGPGATLTLSGRDLAADRVRVRIGGILIDPSLVTAQRVQVVLPASLRAGGNTAQVVHEMALGTPPTPHVGSESNLVAFLVAPRITSPAATLLAVRGKPFPLAVDPPVGRSQRVSLLVGDREIVSTGRVPVPDPSPMVTFGIPADLAAGSYLLRVRVDGADSPLDVDANPASPTFNAYSGPLLKVKP
jgi:hypothetical protein